MVGWSQIPREVKQHVVRKFDFMSRLSLKSSSRQDRQVVNSTALSIPRVRVGYKNEKFLIVIYTGIEKFLRLEFEKCGKGVVIYKSENGFDPSGISKKFIPSSDPFGLGMSILKSLFGHRSIHLEAMEWEVPIEDPVECMKFADRLANSMGAVKLRIKEMTMTWNTSAGFENVFTTAICVPEDLKAFRQIALAITSNSIAPVLVQEFQLIGMTGKPFFITRFVLMNDAPSHNFLTILGVGVLVKLAKYNLPGNEMLGCSFRSVTPIHAVSVTEPGWCEEADQTVLFPNKSSCGYWTHRVMKKKLGSFRKMENQYLPCQLGFLCKKHTDPFNYWYHQNLARRTYQEPFWDSVNWPMLGIEEEHQQNVKALRARVARDEQQKDQSNQGSVPSWGFKSANDSSKNGGKIQKMGGKIEKISDPDDGLAQPTYQMKIFGPDDHVPPLSMEAVEEIPVSALVPVVPEPVLEPILSPRIIFWDMNEMLQGFDEPYYELKLNEPGEHIPGPRVIPDVPVFEENPRPIIPENLNEVLAELVAMVPEPVLEPILVPEPPLDPILVPDLDQESTTSEDLEPPIDALAPKNSAISNTTFWTITALFLIFVSFLFHLICDFYGITLY